MAKLTDRARNDLKKASFLENRICKKAQVKVTLFPGMVFQERIFFLEN